MKQAQFFRVFDKEKRIVDCTLCPRKCRIPDGALGRCHIRKNISGILYSTTYGRFTSVAFDPIEKKPLYHYYPSKEILSVGTAGCNFECPWCQNFEISQASVDEVPTREISPLELKSLAKRYNSFGIAYTYNEPLVNYEFVFDCAKEFYEAGLKNVLVTNFCINEEPFAKLLPYIDAANVDIKFFRNEPYKKICGGDLGAVMRNVEIFFKKGKHIELTFCVIPKENDDENDFKEFVDWIWSLSDRIPLHISRYFPAYKFHRQPTPLKTLYRLRDIAIKKLKFVYLGNVFEESNTYCPNCKALLIKRKGYFVEITGLDGASCKYCGEILPIIF
ncbi:MAG: AmmeMemoRadiSam system radical SAM enzyme [Elusimicrobia bacterium]|nr:AmmeMemoRadiSam system radical SAM enzyme [Elusimicrobiota bacterium]